MFSHSSGLCKVQGLCNLTNKYLTSLDLWLHFHCHDQVGYDLRTVSKNNFLSMYIFSVWSFPCGDIYAEGFWFTNKLLFELFNANSGIIGNISFL